MEQQIPDNLTQTNEPKPINGTDTNPIFDIIQTLQSKMNEPNPPTNNSQNSPSELNQNSIIDMLKILNLQNHSNETKTNLSGNSNANTSNLNIDLNTIMKFQKIFTSMNKTDPRKNLLTSLKPFMRETRQKNIDTYITLLGVINALDIFTNKGSE